MYYMYINIIKIDIKQIIDCAQIIQYLRWLVFSLVIILGNIRFCSYTISNLCLVCFEYCDFVFIC